VRFLHTLAKTRVSFDDPNLISQILVQKSSRKRATAIHRWIEAKHAGKALGPDTLSERLIIRCPVGRRLDRGVSLG